MISAQADQMAQDALIEKYMMLPNQVCLSSIYNAKCCVAATGIQLRM